MSTLPSDWLSTEEEVVSGEFPAEVRSGLLRPGQKELPSRYFYDDLGSALFDAITLLPEYGLTRADARVLQNHASEIAEAARGIHTVAELGSGSGQKTRFLLQSIGHDQPDLRYYPIDVSAAALEHCRRELESIAAVQPVLASYIPGVRLAASRRAPGERMLVLFLGSTIGNFELPCARVFLRQLRDLLSAGDLLLIGADLVKPVDQLIAAYDDPLGVTAAFNLNLLARVNRELGGNFNLRAFAHEVRYDTNRQAVEMHLRSRVAQTVAIPGAACTVRFAEGETIWTESSHKYGLAQLAGMAHESGFKVQAQWTDAEWPFVESLWAAV